MTDDPVDAMTSCRIKTMREWLVVYTKYYASAGKLLIGMDSKRHNTIIEQLAEMTKLCNSLSEMRDVLMTIPITKISTDDVIIKRLKTVNEIFALLERCDFLEDDMSNIIDYQPQVSDFTQEQYVGMKAAMRRLHANWVEYEYKSLLEIICKVNNPNTNVVLWLNSQPTITKFTVGVIQANINETTTGRPVLLAVIDQLRDETLAVPGIPARYKVPFKSVQGILYQKLFPACKSLKIDQMLSMLHAPGIIKSSASFPDDVWKRISRNIGNVIVLNCTSESPIEFSLTGLLTPGGPLNANAGLNKHYIEKYSTAVKLYSSFLTKEPQQIAVYEFSKAENVKRFLIARAEMAHVFSNYPHGVQNNDDDILETHPDLKSDDRWKDYDTSLWYVFQTLDGFHWRPLTNSRAIKSKYVHPQTRVTDKFYSFDDLPKVSLSQIGLKYDEVKFLVEGVSMRAANYNYLLSNNTLLLEAYDPMIKLVHDKYTNEVQGSTETVRSRIYDALMESFKKNKVSTLAKLVAHLIPSNLLDIITDLLPLPERNFITNLEYLVTRTMKISKIEHELENSIMRAWGDVNVGLIRAYKETTDATKLSEELYARTIAQAIMMVEKKELWQSIESPGLKEVMIDSQVI